MERVSTQIDGFEFVVRYGAPGRVSVGVQLALNPQPRPGRVRPDQVHRHLVAHQRLSAPVLAEPVATYRELVSDGNGRFRITDISPTILPPGPYDVRVKARRTLGSRASQVTIPASDSQLFASGTLAVEWDSLRYGDLDDNHVVDDADVEALKTSFARRPGETGFNSQADFNSDQLVDGQDFSILAENFLNRSK